MAPEEGRCFFLAWWAEDIRDVERLRRTGLWQFVYPLVYPGALRNSGKSIIDLPLVLLERNSRFRMFAARMNPSSLKM